MNSTLQENNFQIGFHVLKQVEIEKNLPLVL